MKDSCIHEAAALLTVDQALERIEMAVAPVDGDEILPLSGAFGRIPSADVAAPMDLPPNRVSAMDGYALSAADIDAERPFTLKNIGTSLAGKPFNGQLETGQCIRIFTGAVIPDKADSIIMQEAVRSEGDSVFFPAALDALQNVRPAGSDIAEKELLLQGGKPLNSNDCALLASAGIHDIVVKRKITIACFSTGDELKPLGTVLERGQIYDSNRYALAFKLRDPCFGVADMGVIGDDEKQLTEVLINASRRFDVIITTGGASVGDADYIKEILEKNGNVDFWKIAIKPGKPLIFGKLGKSLFFGLPGNPVSVAVTFDQLVMPALRRLSGEIPRRPFRIRANCVNALKKTPGRREYQRGILRQTEDGEFFVESAGRQDSHQLGSLSRANCYIVLPADNAGVDSGEQVFVEPFSTLI